MPCPHLNGFYLLGQVSEVEGKNDEMDSYQASAPLPELQV
jgi:hypothetical protein